MVMRFDAEGMAQAVGHLEAGSNDFKGYINQMSSVRAGLPGSVRGTAADIFRQAMETWEEDAVRVIGIWTNIEERLQSGSRGTAAAGDDTVAVARGLAAQTGLSGL